LVWKRQGQDVTVVIRSQDSNGKAKLAQALQNVNWTSLYNMLKERKKKRKKESAMI